MTQVDGCFTFTKMDSVSEAVEELLTSAQTHNCLTVGVYESAKLMNIDPDSVLLCILATDEEDEDDIIALQIHFTLIQAFCYENDIDILRVCGLRRLEQLLGEEPEPGGTFTSTDDLHCILVTNFQNIQQALLQSIGKYCAESRSQEQWVPHLTLQEETQEEISGRTTDMVERHSGLKNLSTVPRFFLGLQRRLRELVWISRQHHHHDESHNNTTSVCLAECQPSRSSWFRRHKRK